jgi:hypothetical protein
VIAQVPNRSEPHRATRSPGQIALGPEEAFLAACLASEDVGLTMLRDASPDVFSSLLMRKAREHLIASFHDPLAGLQEDDPELGRLVAGIVAKAHTQQPASGSSLRLSFLQLEQRRIDRELRRASDSADRPRQDELAAARQDVRREMDAVMGQMA